MDSINQKIALQDFDTALLVDRFMRRVHAKVHERAVVFDRDRIGPNGGLTLLTLADIEPAPIHELVRAMARDKSQMTRLLKLLGDKGLIARAASPADARVCVLTLTAKGQVMVEGLREIVAEAVDEVLAPLDGEEKDTFRALLTRAVR